MKRGALDPSPKMRHSSPMEWVSVSGVTATPGQTASSNSSLVTSTPGRSAKYNRPCLSPQWDRRASARELAAAPIESKGGKDDRPRAVAGLSLAVAHPTRPLSLRRAIPLGSSSTPVLPAPDRRIRRSSVLDEQQPTPQASRRASSRRARALLRHRAESTRDDDGIHARASAKGRAPAARSRNSIGRDAPLARRSPDDRAQGADLHTKLKFRPSTAHIRDSG
jgi:hypothetical protein